MLTERTGVPSAFGVQPGIASHLYHGLLQRRCSEGSLTHHTQQHTLGTLVSVGLEVRVATLLTVSGCGAYKSTADSCIHCHGKLIDTGSHRLSTVLSIA